VVSTESNRAIARSIKLGKDLQGDYPEIADLYRGGDFLHGIQDPYGMAIKLIVSSASL